MPSEDNKVKEFDEVIGGATRHTQIIWTSSNNAKKEAFSLGDIQHANGCEPYAASKYAIDCVNVTLNERLNKQMIEWQDATRVSLQKLWLKPNTREIFTAISLKPVPDKILEKKPSRTK